MKLLLPLFFFIVVNYQAVGQGPLFPIRNAFHVLPADAVPPVEFPALVADLNSMSTARNNSLLHFYNLPAPPLAPPRRPPRHLARRAATAPNSLARTASSRRTRTKMRTRTRTRRTQMRPALCKETSLPAPASAPVPFRAGRRAAPVLSRAWG